MTSEASRQTGVTEIAADGAMRALRRTLAVEYPVAIEVNGLGYAVMMMTPTDLDDFAFGFCAAERLIDGHDDVLSVDAADTSAGIVLRIRLVPACADRVLDRVRHRVSESSCGLCGIENLESALRPLPPVRFESLADDAAIFAALAGLPAHQPLNAETGAVHAAALCASDGTIRLAREDVGRHNAFDKLLGAMARQQVDWDGGFALLTSRCSFELVEKAVLAECPMLVTVSLATSLAVSRAHQAGLQLVMLARPDSLLRVDMR